MIAVASASGCEALETEPAGRGRPDGKARGLDQREAPALAKQVRAGDLPPVDERLPKEPLVVQTVDRLGMYGGTWRTALLGVADVPWLNRTVGYEGILRFDPEFETDVPNVAKSVEPNDDGTEYVIKLRKDMRWSDGAPFSADDVVFAQNDVENHQEILPGEEENPGTAEKVDDYTVKLSFAQPKGLFLTDMAAYGGQALVRYPMHHLRQFHKDYNPDVDEVVDEHGYEHWVELFQDKSGITGSYWANSDLPTLYAWRVRSMLGDGDRVVVERNPFYWKVDPEGRQLPYLDEVTFQVVNTAEVILLAASQGEIEMQDRHIGLPQNKPVLAENREGGGYQFYETRPTEMNTTGIAFNLTSKDEVKREIFNNKDFRIGLSYAIDRQEIIDTAFQRQGRPWQLSPRPETRFVNDQLAEQYLDYDVDLANEHLDAAGYDETDADGYRLGPDGKPISFTLSYIISRRPEWADVAALLEGYWDAVGIKAHLRSIDRSLWTEQGEANEFDVTVWAGEFGSDIDIFVRPMWYIPTDGHLCYAPAWRSWYNSGGTAGERPPKKVREQLDLWDQIRVTPEEEERDALMKEILSICAEELLTIGISLSPPGYGIVKNNFHNVPKSMPQSDVCRTPGLTNPEQYFIDDDV